MGCIPQHQWIRKKNLQFLSQLTGVRGNWSLRSCPSSGSSSCSTSHSTEDNGWWQSWSELMPMTKNNDNPTSTLCENKKLLTIKLKLVTQANPARNLSCPQWHLRSPLQLSTKGGNKEKNTNINYYESTCRGKNYTPKNTTVQISMFPHLQKNAKNLPCNRRKRWRWCWCCWSQWCWCCWSGWCWCCWSRWWWFCRWCSNSSRSTRLWSHLSSSGLRVNFIQFLAL